MGILPNYYVGTNATIITIEGIVISKWLVKIKNWWLRSDLRQSYLNILCLTIPQLLRNPPCVEVYLALRDPHSYLLIQAINDLSLRYKVNFKLFLVYESVPGFTLCPKLMQVWALKDAQQLATYFGLTAFNQYPNQQNLIAGQQLWQLSVKNVADALEIFNKVWHNEIEDIIQPSTPVINFQVKNQQKLIRKGHYLPATMYFAGHWFTGIERLTYLEQQLTKLNLNINTCDDGYRFNPVVFKEETTEQVAAQSVLDVFISLRSPYSYLGFIKALRLAKKHHLKVNIKPVVPLVMRGLKVPFSKQRYTVIDVMREAKRAGIALSSFNEPTGQGIINCYQLFAYAELKGKGAALIKGAFEAIYVNNLDLAKTSVVLNLCEQIGLNYQSAIAYQESHDWQLWSEQHLQELSSLGLWGVPCFKLNNTSCWGQDRLFIIEQSLNDMPISTHGACDGQISKEQLASFQS